MHTVTTIYTDRDGRAMNGVVMVEDQGMALVLWTMDNLVWQPSSALGTRKPQAGDEVEVTYAYDMPDGEPIYRITQDGAVYEAQLDAFELPSPEAAPR